MQSIAFIVVTLYVTVGLSQLACMWMDSDSGIILDLRPLSKLLLITTGDDGHIFEYSPCRNAVSCGQNIVMVNQTSPLTKTCYIIGRWDQQITPQYSNENGVDTWQFKYDNGDDDCGMPARTWAPTFVCNPDMDYQIGNVSEVPNSCFYNVTINTRYACQNYTTTTTYAPDDQCIWSSGGNTLNLTIIQGFILNKISDNDPSQIYSLSPCTNNINCNGDNSMMTISTKSNCIQTIARWDQGFTQPEYSNNFDGQWQFVYTNGNGCTKGPESVVSVFWNCNPLAGIATIVAAKEIGICNFEIQIDSNLACF